MQGEKERLLGQRGCVVWFTGLSGSGKTTLSESVERELTRMGRFSVVLDGDKVRAGLNSDLAFSAESRDENVRRLSEVAALMAREGVIVMVSAISPYRKARAHARSLVADGRFVEVFVDTPLGECEARDPKSLYKKARSGEIKGFTGIDDPYETPESPDVWIRPLNGDGGRPMGVEEEIREKTRMILGVLKDQKLLGQGEKEKEKVGETVGRGPS
uniref:Adenylyl-sulfate kinase n=1 Tax=Chromera velia CCMP2878 TaxID=1169474 RepID=A0A0G4FQX3_9ALVE|eukprot:Cvel_18292.t1-p1 / transcript=Cvel_18292.t1 / gene=Cvel_18292 / organism=Chromera_velia_CCMP2878 / gene_product=Adenylyl-sulfate kinase 1, chloroplastic, putative / transcript_product=Adenylyl-sulfate kinase 1, chloroplastic, putative / location=Cvel_scaffold1508:9683-10324(-) / protein_length=214 / sequence_SO=supercontig / SO=protein_coding / is_pseudo=false